MVDCVRSQHDEKTLGAHVLPYYVMKDAMMPYYLPRRRGLDLIVLGLGVCTVWVVQGRGQRGRVRFKQWW